MLRLDSNLIWTVVNLLIWCGLIRFFLFKPINNVIRKREESIQGRYEEARVLKEEAQIEKDKCRAFQMNLEEEKAKVVAQAKEDARTEYDKIVDDARRRAKQIVEDSKREAEFQKEKIVGPAEQEIRSLIMDIASKSLQSSEDDAALYDQFLTKAGEMNHAELQ